MNSFYLAAVADHLWQCTLFAVAVGILTLFLRRNSARTRYLLWLSASVKFLVPFSVLTAAGALIPWSPAPVHDAPSAFLESAAHVAAPVAQWTNVPDPADLTPVDNAGSSGSIGDSGNLALTVLGMVWALGTLAVALRWLARWRLLRRALRESTPADLRFDVPVKLSSHQFEPGVIGVVRPVLLLPHGLDERLTAEQMRAVLAHERCHVVWRDNLGALLHMLVEALFWFHPLVWWLGTRLIDERERACDEQVLIEGHARENYAEGVLKVCEHFLHSRLLCVSGVSGADLRKRIKGIMHAGLIRRLGNLQKAVLAAAALLAIITPVVTGILKSPPVLTHAAEKSPAAPVQAAEAPPAVPVQAAQTRSPVRGQLVFWASAPTPGNPQIGSISVQRDGILINNVPLHYLVAEAYGVLLPQLEGMRWYEDGSAEPPCCVHPYSIRSEGTRLAEVPRYRLSFELTVPERYRPALRDFLAREFGLVVRTSTRQVDGYVITADSGDTRLQPIARSVPQILQFNPGQGVEVTGYSSKEFAALLSKAMSTPFVDATGLQGRYHFDAWLPPDTWQAREARAPAIIAKMKEQLGLRVEARRVTVDVVEVISLKEPAPKLTPIKTAASWTEETLKMVGTMRAGGEYSGLVRARNGLVHQVQTGDYLGANQGRITRIEPTRIRITQIIPDGGGGFMERDADLALDE